MRNFVIIWSLALFLFLFCVGNLLWAFEIRSTYVGGSSTEDDVFGNCIDSSGNIYIAGNTTSADLPLKKNTTNPGDSCFVSKISPAGTISWSVYIGGDGVDNLPFPSYTEDGPCWNLACDDSDHIYIIGSTYSTDLPAKKNDLTPGNKASFITKLSSAGNILWSTYLGQGGNENGFALTFDTQGNIIASGETTDPNLPSKINNFITSIGGNPVTNGFISKINTNGDIVWSLYLPVEDGGNDICTDNGDNMYIAAQTRLEDLPNKINSFIDSDHWHWEGQRNVYVMKISPAGTILWSEYIVSNMYDYIDGQLEIYRGTDGKIYLVATAESPSLVGSINQFSGHIDAFVSKLNSDGSIYWSTYIGGSDDYTSGYSIQQTSTGNIYVCGATESANLPAKRNGIPGSESGFLTKLTANGLINWSLYVGGSSLDLANKMVLDNKENIVLSGSSLSDDFPGRINEFSDDPAFGLLGGDAFVSRISIEEEETDQSRSSPWLMLLLFGE